MTTLYHGTLCPNEILARGFDIDAPRRCDPGDFGWGVYLTSNIARAKGYGTVLAVEVDLSALALVPNPYFLTPEGGRLRSTSPMEELFYGYVFAEGPAFMRTVNSRGEEREAHAKEVRKIFLTAGYKGIRTYTYDRETVVFDTTAILSVEKFKKGGARHSPSR